MGCVDCARLQHYAPRMRSVIFMVGAGALCAMLAGCGDDTGTSGATGGAGGEGGSGGATTSATVTTNVAATTSTGMTTCDGSDFEAACGSCLEASCCAELAESGGDPADPALVDCALASCEVECFPPPEPPPFALECTVPAEASSAGSCVAIDATNTCNPVTNEGCNTDAGEACDLGQNGFECFPDGNTQDLCTDCGSTVGYCKAGLTCFNECARFCCTDDDCGTGQCLKEFDGAALYEVAPSLGVCVPGTPVARVRVAHLSPDTPAVDVCVYPSGGSATTPALGGAGLAYPLATAYLELMPGSYDIGVIAAGANCASPITTLTNVAVEADKAYTIAAVGMSMPDIGDAPLTFETYVDTLTTTAGKTTLRFVHAASGVPAVDVGTGSSAMFSAVWTNTAFGDVGGPTAYVSVDPLVDATLSARATGSMMDALVLTGVSVPGDTVVTLFAIGNQDNAPKPLEVLACFDVAPAPLGGTCVVLSPN
jgi:hypothetical protein